MANKHRKFMEDDFDLDLYIKQQADKAIINEIHEKSKKLSNIVEFMLVVVSFVFAITLFSYATTLIDNWRTNRINQTARSITEHTPASEAAGKQAPTREPEGAPAVVIQGQSALLPTPALMPAILDLRGVFDNDDICAYIKIDGTSIDFPVAQTGDNSFYLSHDLWGQANKSGSAFLDCEGPLSPLGLNTVIYAHNMRDGSMFHDLRYYEDEGYLDGHRAIALQTLYEDTLWEIFSFYETDTNFLYNTCIFNDVNEFLNLAETMKKKSMHPSDVEFTGGTRILTLSTCTGRDAGGRFVAHAYRVR